MGAQVMEMATKATASYELSLDFSNTVDWRNSAKKSDTMKSLQDLVSWSVKKGLIGDKEAASILRPGKDERGEEGTFKKAIQLRETIYRIFSSVAHDHHPDEGDMAALNRFLTHYSVRSTIFRSGEEYGWSMIPEEGLEGRMLWPIAKSAADLLTSDQLGRVTECANEEEGCGWVFLDKTRSKTRRWCSMDGCGNRAKVRAWYERHEKAPRSE